MKIGAPQALFANTVYPPQRAMGLCSSSNSSNSSSSSSSSISISMGKGFSKERG